MSDGLSISSGGAVAVDTAELRAAAAVLARAASQLDEALADLVRAEARVNAHVLFDSDLGRATTTQRAVGALAESARLQQERLLMCAAVYELAEERAAASLAALTGDAEGAATARARIAQLQLAYPDAAALLDAEPQSSAERDARRAFAALAPFTGGLSLLLPALLTPIVGSLFSEAAGRIPYGAAPRPTGRPVPEVVPVRPASGPAVAPTGIASALARIPQGTDARVRIEKYETTDGPAYAVYVAGTQQVAGEEVWDMLSNTQSYGAEASDAYLALTAMLTEAGVRPGDALYLYGHSQGGMLVGQVAATGEYDVRVVGTAGSPTAADPGPDALSAELRHGDDPVAMLADGGFAGRVGGADSFVAERVIDPAVGPHDLGLPAHHLAQYAETAAQVDASGDPRVAGVHARLAELEGARLVSVQEFGARREYNAEGRGYRFHPGAVSPSASGAG